MARRMLLTAASRRPPNGVSPMDWTKPEFVEVKMDAEINSYQDDFSGI